MLPNPAPPEKTAHPVVVEEEGVVGSILRPTDVIDVVGGALTEKLDECLNSREDLYLSDITVGSPNSRMDTLYQIRSQSHYHLH